MINTNIFFIEKSNTEFQILIEPIDRGFSDIIGNSLRRICLLYIEGYAINKIKILNLTNQYNVLKGVKEDIFDIIFNIKNLDISLKENLDKISLTLNDNIIGPITIKNFINSDKVNINNNKIIFNITDNIDFKIKLYINKGVGYVPTFINKKKFFFINDNNILNNLLNIDENNENNENDKKKIYNNEYIYINANYNPIKKISYQIINITYGAFKNKEKIIFSLSTNGLIDIKKTFFKALNMIEKQFINLKNQIFFERKKKNIINKYINFKKLIFFTLKNDILLDYKKNQINFTFKKWFINLKFNLFYLKIFNY